MQSFRVIDKSNGNLLLTVNCFNPKVYKLLLKQFKKVRGINISEVFKGE